mmetsp:Transcript_11241/g.16817  ORF Transcript_11241/g.16817 Transcript_11241/m.16817 type:complete len:760 (-) Transcript_11241:172-2451(-)
MSYEELSKDDFEYKCEKCEKEIENMKRREIKARERKEAQLELEKKEEKRISRKKKMEEEKVAAREETKVLKEGIDGVEFIENGFPRWKGYNADTNVKSIGCLTGSDAQKLFLKDRKAAYLGLEPSHTKHKFHCFLYYGLKFPGFKVNKGTYRKSHFWTYKKEKEPEPENCEYCNYKFSRNDRLGHYIWCSKVPEASAKGKCNRKQLLQELRTKPLEIVREEINIQQLVLQNLERVLTSDNLMLKKFKNVISNYTPFLCSSLNKCDAKGLKGIHVTSTDKRKSKGNSNLKIDQKWLCDKLPQLYSALRKVGKNPMKTMIKRLQIQARYLAKAGNFSTKSHQRIRPRPLHYGCTENSKHRSLFSSVCTTCGAMNTEASARLTKCQHNKAITPMAIRGWGPEGWKSLIPLREKAVVHALDYTATIVGRLKPEKFKYHGGDIIFLYRNAITRSREGKVKEAAKKCVLNMIDRWDLSVSIAKDSQIEYVMGYVECLHAKQELKRLLPEESGFKLKEKIESALKHHALEDVIRFNPHHYLQKKGKPNPKTPKQYCYRCGSYQKNFNQCRECGSELSETPDYEAMCEAVVWTSVFEDINIPVSACDGLARLEHILPLIEPLRPYRDLTQIGRDLFRLQCYFITHLVFILGGWGKRSLRPYRMLLAEELTFLSVNMSTVIRMKDPELVGEFVQALHILGLHDSDPIIEFGHRYLLRTAGSTCWAKQKENFYKRYHSAYCGIIGLTDFQPDKNEKLLPKYIKAMTYGS